MVFCSRERVLASRLHLKILDLSFQIRESAEIEGEYLLCH